MKNNYLYFSNFSNGQIKSWPVSMRLNARVFKKNSNDVFDKNGFAL